MSFTNQRISSARMPITPFHFGPALLLKAVVPRHLSLTAFVVANILIDIESGYFLFTGGRPVHRTLHTFLFGTLAGVIAGVIVHSLPPRFRPRTAADASNGRLYSALLGGGLGGASHALLDGIMHADIHPFRPFSDANPLLLATSLTVLHLFCVVTGGVGLLWLSLRAGGAIRLRSP